MKLSLKWKLIISFTLVVCFFSLSSLFNWQQLNKINEQNVTQNNQNARKLLALELNLKVGVLDALRNNLIITQNLDLTEAFNKERAIFEDLVKQVAETADNAEQRKMSARLINTSGEYTATFDSAVELIKGNTLPPSELNKQLENNFNLSKVHREYIFELIGNFYESYSVEAEAAVAESSKMIDETARISFLALIIVFLASTAIAILLTRSFTEPIAKLQKAVSLIASGDLRHTINSSSKDELGKLSRSFDHMVEQVRSMLGNTQIIASSLSEHSHSFHAFSQSTASSNVDILKAIHEISAGADEQASHSEKSASILSELEDEIQNMTAYTELMKQTSLEAANNTLKGTAAVRALSEGSQQSYLVLDKVDKAMSTLAASSSQIGKIVNSITEISTQTNVLALNAAIEAARAGLHGKGFSVIADEVRNLSSQTNESSKSIGQIIVSLQKQITELQSSMHEASEFSRAQNKQVEDTLNSFEGIELSMQQIGEQINQVHVKIDQARLKNEQLVAAVQHVAAIAQETAAGVEEVNSTSIQQDASIRRIADEADDIHGLSLQLFEEISRFQIDISEANQVVMSNDEIAEELNKNLPEDFTGDINESLAEDIAKEMISKAVGETGIQLESSSPQTLIMKSDDQQEQEPEASSSMSPTKDKEKTLVTV
jgi:methyl-accepting chemotaxis protein